MFSFVPDGRMFVITEHSLWSRCEPGTSSALWGWKCLCGARSLWTPDVFFFVFFGCKNSSQESGWMRLSLAQLLCPDQKDLNVKQHLWSSLLLFQLLYEDTQMVTLTAPYIAGFLAFRETPFLLEALQRLRRNQPELLPQVRLMMRDSVSKIFCQRIKKRPLFSYLFFFLTHVLFIKPHKYRMRLHHWKLVSSRYIFGVSFTQWGGLDKCQHTDLT